MLLLLLGLAVFFSMRNHARANGTMSGTYPGHDYPGAADDEAYWALMAGGLPDMADVERAGQVQPGVWTHANMPAPAWREPLLMPPAGSGYDDALSSSLPGITLRPGPMPPAQPGPQNPTESSSPWLDESLQVPWPLSANPWFFDASGLSPIDAPGGTIDVEPRES